MNNRFDIFKRLPNGNTLWITTVEGLVEAKTSHGPPGGNLWWRIFRLLTGRRNRGRARSELPAPGGSCLIGKQARAARRFDCCSRRGFDGIGDRLGRNCPPANRLSAVQYLTEHATMPWAPIRQAEERIDRP